MSDDSSEQTIVPKRSLDGFPAAFFSLLGVFFVYFILPVIAVLAVSLYPLLHGQTLAQAQHWIDGSVTAQFFYILLAEGLTVLVIFGLLRLFRWRREMIGLKMPRWYHPLLGVAAVVPYFILYLVLLHVASAVFPDLNTNQQQQIGFDSVHGGLQLGLTFLSLVVLPPLAEEITMRGFLYTGFKKWLPRIVAALLVSALFGAAHLAEGGAAGPLWVGALDTFSLSLILVWLREATGNLWAGITLHALKNGIAFVSLFILHVR